MFDRSLSILIAPSLLLAACAGGEVPPSGATGGELEVAQAPAEAQHTAEAQPTERVERRLARMRERLELDDAQVELLRPILERHAAERQAARARFREDVAGVLTPDQLERFEARFERRGRHGRHRRAFRRLVRDLALTDAQKEQVRPIWQGLRERRREIRDLPREERRAAIEAAHAEVRAQLVPILDAEQLATLDEFAERMRRRHERRQRE